MVSGTRRRIADHWKCWAARRGAAASRRSVLTMSEYEAHVAPPTRVAKGRSASICATSCASLEEIAESASTPTARRRRPATRSQSARISAGRTAKRRPAAPPTTGTHHLKNHCISEPKLADQATPEISPYIKRKGNRRGTSVYHRYVSTHIDRLDRDIARIYNCIFNQFPKSTSYYIALYLSSGQI